MTVFTFSEKQTDKPLSFIDFFYYLFKIYLCSHLCYFLPSATQRFSLYFSMYLNGIIVFFNLSFIQLCDESSFHIFASLFLSSIFSFIAQFVYYCLHYLTKNICLFDCLLVYNIGKARLQPCFSSAVSELFLALCSVK